MNHDEPTGETFGSTMRRRRLDAGLSQRALSQRLIELGVTIDQAAITRMESGQREPRLSEAIAIAEFLQFDLMQVELDQPNVSFSGAMQVGTQKFFAARAAIDEYLKAAQQAAQQFKTWERGDPDAEDDGPFLEHVRTLPGSEPTHNATAVDWSDLDWSFCEPYVSAVLNGLHPESP
ncbi:helix-turn-helix domain-containing protein [Williamsia herbipolensis]|uniref:helix-turn-helix domain-containing protein n=1 Tax=Williamsia herbipolensis TaxID=1603258 RepID=UPI0005F78C97|nr:helix-turn-helix transcriptional regulator [Williamsia herbipolensis]